MGNNTEEDVHEGFTKLTHKGRSPGSETKNTHDFHDWFCPLKQGKCRYTSILMHVTSFLDLAETSEFENIRRIDYSEETHPTRTQAEMDIFAPFVLLQGLYAVVVTQQEQFTPIDVQNAFLSADGSSAQSLTVVKLSVVNNATNEPNLLLQKSAFGSIPHSSTAQSTSDLGDEVRMRRNAGNRPRRRSATASQIPTPPWQINQGTVEDGTLLLYISVCLRKHDFVQQRTRCLLFGLSVVVQTSVRRRCADPPHTSSTLPARQENKPRPFQRVNSLLVFQQRHALEENCGFLGENFCTVLPSFRSKVTIKHPRFDHTHVCTWCVVSINRTTVGEKHN